jgi:citrate synthase
MAHLWSSAAGPDLPHSWWHDAVMATGAMAVFATAWWRTRSGLAPIAPEPSSRHVADYVRMLRGGAVSEAEAEALDAYFVTVIDHGMNASTFAARVVASTGSDTISALTAAIGALKGPLHGGAPGPVLDMLDQVGQPERAPHWIETELRAGRRIMGMGHRVYRVRDPRASTLEQALLRLGRAREEGGASSDRTALRLALARAVEEAAEKALAERHPERPLKANVEFFTAVLLDAIGVPRQLFTPTFAASRVAGWCAHVEEQRRTGKLIRPASRYIAD